MRMTLDLRSFLAFGAGPRFCPGRNLALLEAKKRAHDDRAQLPASSGTRRAVRSPRWADASRARPPGLAHAPARAFERDLLLRQPRVGSSKSRLAPRPAAPRRSAPLRGPVLAQPRGGGGRRVQRPTGRRNQAERHDQEATAGDEPPARVGARREESRVGCCHDGDRPDERDSQRLADLAAGRGDGRGDAGLRRRHARDRGVRDRRVDRAEADPEDM